MSERDELILAAIAGRHIASSGWVRGDCPYCETQTGTADKRQCFGVHVFSGNWHCFRCGAAGLLQDIPEDLESSDRQEPAAKEATTIVLPEGFLPLYEEPGLSFPFTDGPRAYLTRRGLSAAVGREAKIGVVFTGKYRGRVVVPIFDELGRVLVGWSARSYVDSPSPKYLYPVGMDRRSIVFNGAALRRDTLDPVYVVEGVFDALALWPDAIAVLGKPSSPQLELLVSTKRPIVVLLDGDAWRESLAVMLRLKVRGCTTGSVRLPPRRDPATVPIAEVRRLGVLALAAGAQLRLTEA
jgi:hypothetical protein